MEEFFLISFCGFVFLISFFFLGLIDSLGGEGWDGLAYWPFSFLFSFALMYFFTFSVLLLLLLLFAPAAALGSDTCLFV